MTITFKPTVLLWIFIILAVILGANGFLFLSGLFTGFTIFQAISIVIQWFYRKITF